MINTFIPLRKLSGMIIRL